MNSIDEILQDLRAGKMIVLVDDESRENEGDLVCAAEKATAEAINFMARYGRGMICVPMSRLRAEELGLHPQVVDNTALHGTAFTVTVDAAAGVTTGISAADRARTARVLAADGSRPADLVRPGHMFPLRARDGGVLVRAGQTEGAVDLCRLAGLKPVGVICEIMNDDGTMARLPDLVQFAQLHGLKVGTIADLIAYRRRNDHIVQRAVDTTFQSRNGGDWKMMVYVNTIEYAEHIALVKGDVTTPEPVLVRMHAINILNDMLADAHHARDPLGEAMRIIAREGRGVVVVLRQTRPTFVSDLVLRRGTDDIERRVVKEYGVGAQILLDLGIKDMILLTDTPEKRVVALDGYGLNIIGTHRISKKDTWE
jgi:3,4-dihydroxy 2-butanone 4-phosphate synthase / GTP cyclohydrolase II